MPLTAILPKGPASNMAGGSPDSGPVMEGVASAVGAAAVAGGAGVSLTGAGLADAGGAFCALQTEANPKQNVIATTLPT